MIPISLVCNELEKFTYCNTSSSQRFKIESGRIGVKRLKIGSINQFTNMGTIITPEGGTVFADSADSVDYDKATSGIATGVGGQTLLYQMTASVICNYLWMKFLLNEDETLGNVTIEISPDDSNYKEIYNNVPDSDELSIIIDGSIGAEIKSVRVIMNGTALDPESVFLKEIQLYNAICYPYRSYKEPGLYLYIEPLDKAKLKTMTAFDVVIVTSGAAEIRCQLEKGNTYYFWNGSAWAVCSKDHNLFPIESSLIGDIQANMATFLPGSADTWVGVRFIFIPDNSISPFIETINISGT